MTGLIAPWRSLIARALHRNRSLASSRYVQLATISKQQRPTNRTVVFRGFEDGSDQLRFVTDSRSAKICHLQFSPWVEVCWYFSKTREQFRIAGQLLSIDQHSAVDQLIQRYRMWQALSESARSQFLWPPPGQPITQDNTTAALNLEEPAASFCLLLLESEQVDHLELRGDPQRRCLYRREASNRWSIEPVNP